MESSRFVCASNTFKEQSKQNGKKGVAKSFVKNRDFASIGPKKGARQRMLEIFKMIFSVQDKNIIRKYVFFRMGPGLY